MKSQLQIRPAEVKGPGSWLAVRSHWTELNRVIWRIWIDKQNDSSWVWAAKMISGNNRIQCGEHGVQVSWLRAGVWKRCACWTYYLTYSSFIVSLFFLPCSKLMLWFFYAGTLKDRMYMNVYELLLLMWSVTSGLDRRRLADVTAFAKGDNKPLVVNIYCGLSHQSLIMFSSNDISVLYLVTLNNLSHLCKPDCSLTNYFNFLHVNVAKAANSLVLRRAILLYGSLMDNTAAVP